MSYLYLFPSLLTIGVRLEVVWFSPNCAKMGPTHIATLSNSIDSATVQHQLTTVVSWYHKFLFFEMKLPTGFGKTNSSFHYVSLSSTVSWQALQCGSLQCRTAIRLHLPPSMRLPHLFFYQKSFLCWPTFLVACARSHTSYCLPGVVLLFCVHFVVPNVPIRSAQTLYAAWMTRRCMDYGRDSWFDANGFAITSFMRRLTKKIFFYVPHSSLRCPSLNENEAFSFLRLNWGPASFPAIVSGEMSWIFAVHLEPGSGCLVTNSVVSEIIHPRCALLLQNLSVQLSRKFARWDASEAGWTRGRIPWCCWRTSGRYTLRRASGCLFNRTLKKLEDSFWADIVQLGRRVRLDLGILGEWHQLDVDFGDEEALRSSFVPIRERWQP